MSNIIIRSSLADFDQNILTPQIVLNLIFKNTNIATEL